MQFIAIFLPSLLGTGIYAKLEMNIKSIVRCIYSYIMFSIGTNLFTMFTVTYVLGIDGIVSEALTSFNFFMIYTIMSIFFSVAGAILGRILRDNFSKWD